MGHTHQQPEVGSLTSVEVLVLVPLLVTIFFLNAVLIDLLSEELEESEELGEKFNQVFSNSSHWVHESLVP